MVARSRSAARRQPGIWGAVPQLAWLLIAVPGLWTATAFFMGTLGPRPITAVIHELGLWAVRFLLLSLAVTPAARIFALPRLIVLRRILGLAALAYAIVHLELYLADQAFDLAKVGREIVARIYLAIGITALSLMIPLGVTSTNAMIRRLGSRNWRRLHRLAYLIAVLALIHFFMQSKLDVTQPVMMAGAFVWLMGFRLVGWAGWPARAASWPVLLLLGLAAGFATMLGEALYFRLVNGIPAEFVLRANLMFVMGPRPAVVVLAVGLTVAVLALLLAPARNRRARPGRPELGAVGQTG